MNNEELLKSSIDTIKSLFSGETLNERIILENLKIVETLGFLTINKDLDNQSDLEIKSYNNEISEITIQYLYDNGEVDTRFLNLTKNRKVYNLSDAVKLFIYEEFRPRNAGKDFMISMIKAAKKHNISLEITRSLKKFFKAQYKFDFDKYFE